MMCKPAMRFRASDSECMEIVDLDSEQTTGFSQAYSLWEQRLAGDRYSQRSPRDI